MDRGPVDRCDGWPEQVRGVVVVAGTLFRRPAVPDGPSPPCWSRASAATHGTSRTTSRRAGAPGCASDGLGDMFAAIGANMSPKPGR